MRDLDLIPPEHLQIRRLRRWIRVAGLIAGLWIAATVLARLAIELRLAKERPQLAQMQQAAEETRRLSAEWSALRTRQAELQAKLETLEHLRRPAPWMTALHSVDQALGPGLWFDQLTFEQNLAAAPASTDPKAPKPAMPTPLSVQRQRQTLEIRGHALEHGGVTALVGRLREQPALQDVRLSDTLLRRYTDADVIDFNVTAQIGDLPSADTPEKSP